MKPRVVAPTISTYWKGAPFQYVEIVGATTLGFIFFGDFPDPLTWVGVAVIVSSGLYVYYRERKLAAETSSSPESGDG